MDLGVALPVSAPFASPEAIARVAQQAESLGYGAVWTHERLLYPIGGVAQGGGPPRPLPDDKRPFLGGSTGQIAKDLEGLEPLALDQVLFNDEASSSLEEHLERLEELQLAVRP